MQSQTDTVTTTNGFNVDCARQPCTRKQGTASDMINVNGNMQIQMHIIPAKPLLKHADVHASYQLSCHTKLTNNVVEIIDVKTNIQQIMARSNDPTMLNI